MMSGTRRSGANGIERKKTKSVTVSHSRLLNSAAKGE